MRAHPARTSGPLFLLLVAELTAPGCARPRSPLDPGDAGLSSDASADVRDAGAVDVEPPPADAEASIDARARDALIDAPARDALVDASDAGSGGEGGVTADAFVGCEPALTSSAIGARVFEGTTTGLASTPRVSRCLNAGPDVVLRWTAPRAGRFLVSSSDSRFDTVLSVSRACDGAELDCNDDGAGVRSMLTLEASAGETFFLRVDGPRASAHGSYAIDVLESSEPGCAEGTTCAGDYRNLGRYGFLASDDGECAGAFSDAIPLYVESDLEDGTIACACECGAPRGGACVSSFECDYGASCVSTPGTVISASSCVAAGLYATSGADPYSCRATTPVPSGAGRCDSNVVQTERTAPSWAPRAFFCALPETDVYEAGGCDGWSSVACVPRWPADEPQCLLLPGSASCPGAYTQRTVYRNGVITDNRACDEGTCGCSDAAITACEHPPDRSPRVELFVGDTCGTMSLVRAFVADGECHSVSWGPSGYAGTASLADVEPVLSSCTPTGAAAVRGAAYPLVGGDRTLCCKPSE